MKNKNKILISIGVLLVIVAVIGISYALWTFNIAQVGVNTITTDCFKIEFMDKNAISLNNAYPIEDEMGIELTPYTFTLTNVCNGSAKYQINLETMVPSGKKLPDKYLKANLSEGSISKITTKLDKTINSSLATDTTIDGAVDAYKLVSGILSGGESKEFNLRIWMHSDVTASDEDSMNASFEGKISIISSYYEDNRGTMMAVNIDEENEIYTGGFLNYLEYYGQITRIVIEDKLNRYETSEELIYDLSEEQNESVMSYLVSNEGSETYTLYVESDGGIKANQNSSYLFYNFTNLESIEGLEYLDTSNVTDMFGMFAGCSNLTNLDISSFNTSNVTNMPHMFGYCNSLTNLDLSNFDTSSVTDMSGMFQSCSVLINLDLSNFDTSNVTNMSDMFGGCSNLINLDLSSFDTGNVTDMSGMFAGCSSLINLDLSNFDTSNVTNMSGMFSGCSSLINLDLSNFDTSNVTNMSNMFASCYNLTNLDLSSFDTSNVTNMSYMFMYCSNLTSLDISSFDTSNVTNMSTMFSGCSSLINLDLSNFDTSNVTYMIYMFASVPNESTIYVKDETTQNWILNLNSTNRPLSWTVDNVIIKA